MTLERLAAICFCLAITAAVAAAQQKSGSPPQAPTTTVTEQTPATSDQAPARRVQTRTESGGREVIVETSVAPNVNGRLASTQEDVVETVRTPGSSQTRREVFGYADGKRQLLQTTESVRETLANGDTSTVQTTWAQDINGRAGLTS